MKHNFSDVVRANLYVAKLLFQNTPVFMVLYCCMRIVLAILPAFTVLFSKNVIDGLIALYRRKRWSMAEHPLALFRNGYTGSAQRSDHDDPQFSAGQE